MSFVWKQVFEMADCAKDNQKKNCTAWDICHGIDRKNIPRVQNDVIDPCSGLEIMEFKANAEKMELIVEEGAVYRIVIDFDHYEQEPMEVSWTRTAQKVNDMEIDDSCEEIQTLYRHPNKRVPKEFESPVLKIVLIVGLILGHFFLISVFCLLSCITEIFWLVVLQISAEDLWRRDLFLGRSSSTDNEQTHGVSGIAMNRQGTPFTIHAPDPSAFLGFVSPNRLPASPLAATMETSFGIRSTPLTSVQSPDEPIPSYMPQYNDLSPFNPLNRGPFFCFPRTCLAHFFRVAHKALEVDEKHRCPWKTHGENFAQR
ncbi:unnamed protein product, partial [Mesorhabditis belari]|uniref:Uncharacterized protein n=1 Tax=Mesorhabditis belari TaxID=2138241 RepID=A0AAF3F7Y5_9BILA